MTRGATDFEFHKMHGAGNDFVLIDARTRPVQLDGALAMRIADRHTGIGCDQILVVLPARQAANRARYEIFNADGSLAGQCGNGARCIALYLDQADGPLETYSLESPAGPVTVKRIEAGYEIDMGVPRFDPPSIPLQVSEQRQSYRADSPWGEFEFGAVFLGNPNSLVLVDDIEDPLISRLGAFLGDHELFPEGVNAGFAQIIDRQHIRLRVVERGAGETLACGSGACAAVAVLRQRGQVDEQVKVDLPGGRLVIKWREEDAPIFMAGPAQHVFKGTMNE